MSVDEHEVEKLLRAAFEAEYRAQLALDKRDQFGHDDLMATAKRRRQEAHDIDPSHSAAAWRME